MLSLFFKSSACFTSFVLLWRLSLASSPDSLTTTGGCAFGQPLQSMGMLQAASRMNNSWSFPGRRRRRKSGTSSTSAAPISATLVESKEVLMAKIADFVYTFAGPAGPWILAKTWDQQSKLFGGKDHLAIYQSGNQCAVAFAGTDDVSDLSDDLDVREKEACGHSFHKGFYEEFQNFLSGEKWSSEFQPYLKSDACSGGIIAVGHSLGGALASVFATCANAPGNPLGTQLGFLITSLYTVGAPALAKSSPRNGQTSSGCFDGARFFIEDSRTYDPVSYAAVLAGFEHPRVKAIQLHSNSDDILSFNTFWCKSDEARFNSDEPGMQFPSKDDHRVTTYISRIEKLFVE